MNVVIVFILVDFSSLPIVDVKLLLKLTGKAQHLYPQSDVFDGFRQGGKVLEVEEFLLELLVG